LRCSERPPGDHPVLVQNNEDAAVAAAHSVDPDRWWTGFVEVRDRIAARFTRHEPRRHAASLMLGLMSDLGRKNCWSIAEHRGDRSPDALQHLLSRAVWDADGVRDDLRRYVTDHLGDEDAVLVVDETGDLKRGNQTVGVQRQYTGTAGRIENAQVAVYLAYATPAGHTLIDRALYLPQAWVDDPDRCAIAGVPGDVGFATKPTLATGMITAALDADVPAGWVAGDEVYGADPTLRATLEDRGVGYVLAVASNRRIAVGKGVRRVDELTAELPTWSWQRLSAGVGAHGPRMYSWSWVPIPAVSGHRWVLVRRNDSTGELAYYLTFSPHPVPLRTLVRVAGQRWRVEESFQTSKGLTGLDEHQVRRWTSWHRWVTLAMLAHAFLTVITAAERDATPTPNGLIPITVNEQRRLIDALILRPHRALDRLLHWSTWRRRHQARARLCHYRRREQSP
jgi:SRSO17 transposase